MIDDSARLNIDGDELKLVGEWRLDLYSGVMRARTEGAFFPFLSGYGGSLR